MLSSAGGEVRVEVGSVGVRMGLTLRGGVCRGKWREDRVEWLH